MIMIANNLFLLIYFEEYNISKNSPNSAHLYHGSQKEVLLELVLNILLGLFQMRKVVPIAKREF